MEIISGEFLQRRGLVVTAMGEGRAKRPNQRTTPQTGWKTTDRFLLQRHRSAVGKQLNRYALSLDFDQTMRALNGPNLHWCWKVKFRPLRSVPAFTINWDLQNNVKREKHFEENIAAESAASWQQHINTQKTKNSCLPLPLPLLVTETPFWEHSCTDYCCIWICTWYHSNITHPTCMKHSFEWQNDHDVAFFLINLHTSENQFRSFAL